MNKYKKTGAYLLVIFLVSLFYSVMAAAQTENILNVHNVLILGNSITLHTPNPDLGWFGNWGMAASAKEKDYVHDLMRKFKRTDPSVKFHVKTIVAFERSYWNYDFSKLDSFRNLKPELIILHIGENVPAKMFDRRPFGPYYSKLLTYFISGDPGVKIICTSSFWNQKKTTAIIEKETRRKNCFYVKIDQLSSDSANMAIGKFKNGGVAIHPSDAGMQAMAGLIWQKVGYIYEIKQ